MPKHEDEEMDVSLNSQMLTVVAEIYDSDGMDHCELLITLFDVPWKAVEKEEGNSWLGRSALEGLERSLC